MESLPAVSADDLPCETQENACMQFRAAVQKQWDKMLDEVMVQFESHIAKTSTGTKFNEPSCSPSTSHSDLDGATERISFCKSPLHEGDDPAKMSDHILPERISICQSAMHNGDDPPDMSEHDLAFEHMDLDFGHEEMYPLEHPPVQVSTSRPSVYPSKIPSTKTVQEEFINLVHASQFEYERFGHTWQYDVVIGFLIVLNAVCLGWQLEHKARHGEASSSESYIAAIFTVIFFLDVLIRLRESKMEFYLGIDKYWNLFDTFVVGTMISEQMMRIFSIGDSSSLSTLSALRVLRLLRLLRILRILKVLAFFKEFRLMCQAIMSSSTWRILFWVIVLLGIFLYITALALTQLAVDQCNLDTPAVQLCRNFGSIPDTLFTLFKIMYNGVAWGQHVDELQQLGYFPVGLLSFFVLLTGTLVSNGITGIVIRDINQCAEMVQDWRIMDDEARQTLLVKELEDLFYQIDVDGSRCMSFYELDNALRDPQISKIFDSLKLQPHDMQELFYLLDADNTGEIEIEAFIVECVRLRNDARAMDVWQLQNETKKLAKTLQGVVKLLEEHFSKQPLISSFSEHEISSQSARNRRLPKVDSTSQPSSPRKMSVQSLAQGLHNVSSQQMLHLVRDKSHSGEPIKRTEMRAMSLKDLRGVCTWIRSQCQNEGWRDRKTGDKILPANVNLYHFSHHVICPMSAPDGIMMQGLQNGLFQSGQSVLQRTFGEALPAAEGVVKSDGGNCLEVQVTRGRFGVSNGPVEVDGQDYGSPTYVDVLSSSSYKEMISSKPLQPLWFVSHYWGSSVFDFVACCEQHAKSWDLPETTASYWVCGYANRQWALEMEIGNELETCSFHMAMQLSMGTLLILDNEATPFDRIWCDFEITKTLMREDMLLDMATVLQGDVGTKSRPVVLSSGNPPHMSIHAKTAREERFPLRLAVKGILAKLEEGSSTVPTDKSNILRHVRTFCLDASIVDLDHAKLNRYAFKQVNNALHAHLALCVWPQALRRGIVLDLDEDHPGTLSLPDVLKKDEGRTSLFLDLSHSCNLDDEGIASVADGLPPNLMKLDLNFTGCSHVTDQGMHHLAAKLPHRLQSLKLNFTGCEQVTDAGLVFMAGCLGRLTHLTQLRLGLAGCHHIDVHGLHALAHGTPRSLTDFSAVLLGTRVNTNIKSAKLLERLRRNI